MAPLPSGTGRLNPNHTTTAPSHACARSVLYPLEECDGTRELCGPLPNSTITASHPEWVRRFDGDACPQLLFNSNWSLKAYHEPAITLAARSVLHQVHVQANCAINMRCDRMAPPRGFYGLEADVFMRTAVSFVARSRGHGVPASIVIFLSPTVF